MQVLRSEHIPEGGLGEEPRRVVGVLHVGHAHGRVAHTVVDDGVHAHRHGVLRQHLQVTGGRENEERSRRRRRRRRGCWGGALD